MARLKLVLKNFSKFNAINAFCFACLFTFLAYFLVLRQGEFWSRQKPPEHTLCVLVPFRNVFEELQEFIPFMNAFLNRQSIKFHFIVVNHLQDGNRFNKGVCFNAGYEIISKNFVDCDYIALHDIDLLPLNDNIPYTHPGDDVYHVAHPDLHPLGTKYDPQRYVGGIALISNKQYVRINGFGNNFWGWGGEDRNFYYRMSNNSIIRNRPINLTTNRNNTFKNIHSPNRLRDFTNHCAQGALKTNYVEYDFESGLNDVNYELDSKNLMEIDEIPLSFFNIKIPCNYTKTPWCKPSCQNNT